jgi:type I restriction-modification system DNA methylase subunit
MSRESLASDIWRACDVMRRDDGTTGIMEYMEQLSWLLFLKAFEDIEDRHEITVRNYKSEYARALDGPYRWSVWTGSRRKRAEQRVEEARQVLSKALANFERVRRRTDSLRLDKDQASKDNHVVKADKTTDTEQGYLEAQWMVDEAEIDLQNAETELQSTITWLNEQVKILYDEQNVENQVLSLIERQFGGQLSLTEDQLNLLRDTERQLGQALAVKLVKGLEGQELLNFVDDRLFPYLRHLSGTPEQNTISSIFREIPGNRMRSANNLRKVITLLSGIHFDNQQDTQIVSQIYEVLLSRLGTEGGIAGEFYTPRPIINFMVQVINPKIGETLYDPFSGSAGFLVEAFKRMSVQELTLKDHETLQRFTFYGQEKKPLPTLLGMMNMILHGVLTPNISRTNTFANEDIRDIPLDQRYNIILTNPPFGASEDPDVQINFPIQSTATELLALQYIMAKLQPNGRCGVIVPNGTLSSAVEAFINVKKMLLEKFNLYAEGRK